MYGFQLRLEMSVFLNTDIKPYMKSYTGIPMETAVIFFLVNLFLKQGISSEHVMVDFICMAYSTC